MRKGWVRTRATHVNTCRACKVEFHPRQDLPRQTFCSNACRLGYGSRRVDGPVGLTGSHDRVKKKYGKATEYSCFALCCRPARQWACWGEYSNIEEYVPMCVSCHKTFDMARIRKERAAA